VLLARSQVSEDTLNIREFLWNIHYLWALPLKVLVLVGLLYEKMGIAGATAVVIGSAVIVPLQFIVGKCMSANNKNIFAAQDARMCKSTETIQGMKSVSETSEAHWDEIRERCIQANTLSYYR